MRGTAVSRPLALVGLILAFAACVLLLFGGLSGEDYRVKLVFDDAGQVVTGNQVEVGGVAIGSVESLRVNDDGLAELEVSIEDDLAPLHEGTTAAIRSPALASVAGRYIVLTPGPNDAEEIPSGSEVKTEETAEIVDLDQVLNALDPRTVASLSQIVRGSTTAAKGRGRDLDAAIEALNPALSRTASTFSELNRDQEAFERLIVSSAGVVEELAARRDDISGGTEAAAATLRTIAEERDSVAGTLEAAPPALRRGSSALEATRGLLDDLEPAIGEARPAARGLSSLLPKLRPASVELRRQLPAVRNLLNAPGGANDAADLLAGLPGLATPAVPLLNDLTAVGREARPVLGELRPYIPELTSGIVAGFGGSSGGYYDANGHYARISFAGGPFSLPGTASPLFPNLGAIKSKASSRCPGGAIYPAADGSNPFLDQGQLDCDPDLAGSGP